MTTWLPLKYVSWGEGNVSGEKDCGRPFGLGGVFAVCLAGGIAPCDLVGAGSPAVITPLVLGGTRLDIGVGAGSRAGGGCVLPRAGGGAGSRVNVGSGGAGGSPARCCSILSLYSVRLEFIWSCLQWS